MVTKSFDDFYKKAANKDGRSGRCKDCKKAYQSRHRAENYELYRSKERARQGTRTNGKRAWHRKRKYGISESEWHDLLAAQNDACAICGSSEPGGQWQNWHTDHDHKTGMVRGLLCNGCNLGLGHFQDDPERLEAAAAYIRSKSEAGLDLPSGHKH